MFDIYEKILRSLLKATVEIPGLNILQICHSNVVNVPADVNTTMSMLPRLAHENQIQSN